MTTNTARTIKKTGEFEAWLVCLRDEIAKGAINERIDRVGHGNFGDVKKVQNAKGLYELRIDVGPGYRVYFVVVGNTIVLLLLGGSKRSQTADIALAKAKVEDILRTQADARKRRDEQEKKAANAARYDSAQAKSRKR